jgi:hypothetical protein
MVGFLGTDVWVRLSPHNIRWCRVGKLVMMSPSKRAAGSCEVAVTGWIYLSLLPVGIHMGEVLSPKHVAGLLMEFSTEGWTCMVPWFCKAL